MGDLVPLRRNPATSREMSDEALVVAAAAGDGAALGALFDRFHGDVWAFLARVAICPAADLDDLVQATFVEVFRSARRYERRAAVKTWIFGIAVNIARHHARSETRRHAAIARLADVPRADAPRPDVAAEQSQLAAYLAEALEQLPYDLRVAYVLCVLEELPAHEAARALGTREGTVWRRVHDARVRLKSLIESRPP